MHFDDLCWIGRNLLAQAKYREAEQLLRDGLALCEKWYADDWRRFSLMNLLGGALLGQGRFADAEPFIVDGYRGMRSRQVRIDAPHHVFLADAAARIVLLYETTKNTADARRWKEQLGLADLPAYPFASRP